MARRRGLGLLSVGVLLLFSRSFAVTAVQSPEDLGKVEVRGQAPLRATPGDGTELDGEIVDLPRDRETSLPRLMSRSTALTPRLSGGDNDTPAFLVRGQDPTQTRYFLEGVPLSDAQFNAANLVLLPLEMLGKVEVYPEGVPVALADDGLGGAIHFRLRDPAGDALKTRFALRGGSYRSARGYFEHDFSTPVPVRLHVDYAQAAEDFTYFDDNGTPFNTADDSYQRRESNSFRGATVMSYARLWENDQHALSLFSLTSYREQDIPGPTTNPLRATLTQIYETAGLTHSGEWSPRRSSQETLFARWNQQAFRNVSVFPSAPPADSSDLSLGTRLRARFLISDRWRLSTVLGAVGESFSVTPVGGRTQWQARWQFPIGLTGEWHCSPALRLTPAVMSHHYRYRAASGDVAYLLVSPRVGAQGLLNAQLGWHASLGRFYRAPTMFELYGAPTGVSAARDLTYEQAWKADAGLDARVGDPWPVIRELRAFYAYSISRASDLIAYVQNSQSTRIATNVGESLVQTHELAVEARSAWPVRAKSGVMVIDARNLSDIPSQYGKSLPLRPAYRWQNELAYETPRFSAGYFFTLDGPVYADLTETRRLQAVPDHGIWATYASQSCGTFTFEARNLADTTTTGASVSGLPITDNTTGYYGFPAPGRRVYLTWKYEL